MGLFNLFPSFLQIANSSLLIFINFLSSIFSVLYFLNICALHSNFVVFDFYFSLISWSLCSSFKIFWLYIYMLLWNIFCLVKIVFFKLKNVIFLSLIFFITAICHYFLIL